MAVQQQKPKPTHYLTINFVSSMDARVEKKVLLRVESVETGMLFNEMLTSAQFTALLSGQVLPLTVEEDV